jgi:formate hydrogenlyase subunit 6/NADH:ubiquinone oxidoreductase subunit I
MGSKTFETRPEIRMAICERCQFCVSFCGGGFENIVGSTNFVKGRSSTDKVAEVIFRVHEILFGSGTI